MEFADGYERLHFGIEKQALKEMQHGYELLIAATNKERDELNQQKGLLQLDAHAIVSILQYSSTSAVDLLAFSPTSRRFRSMLMKSNFISQVAESRE